MITKEHPDKGGDPEKFARIQSAYEVLSSDVKRRQYDETGEIEKTVDEEFMDSFGSGKICNICKSFPMQIISYFSTLLQKRIAKRNPNWPVTITKLTRANNTIP